MFSIICLSILAIIPAIAAVREAGRQTECTNRLKSLGLTLHTYYDIFHRFPSGCCGNNSMPPDKQWSWYPFVASYWGHFGHPLLDLQRAWDDPELRPLMLHTWTNPGPVEFDVPLIPFYGVQCPNGTAETYWDGQPFTQFVGITGVGACSAELPRSNPRAGIWAYQVSATLDQTTDGTAYTLLLMETARDNGCWLAGGQPTVRGIIPNVATLIGDNAQFGGLHLNVALAVLADGSVRRLPRETDSGIIESLATIANSD